MNRYWKLVHYELFRIRKLYMALFALTLLMQVAGLILFTRSYMADVHKILFRDSTNAANYLTSVRLTSFYSYTTGLWFTAPIMIGAALLLLYVFLIWYRDWLGKNVFIYRLFMIPTSRMNVYLAKLSAILLLVLGLVSFELLILPVQNVLFDRLVPAEYRYSFAIPDLIITHPLLRMFAPGHFLEFVLYYAAGLAGVIVIFTAILIERSYRLKGAIGGIVYGGVSAGFLILPIFITETYFPNVLYPSELFTIELAVGILIVCGSLAFSSYLINRKVTV